MTPKQTRFVAEYLIDLNATQAAIRAGYSKRTANRIASHLLSKVDTQQAIEARKTVQLQSADLTATRVLEEIRRLAFSDVTGLFDEQGNLKPLHTLTPEQSAAIASLEIVRRNLASGDGHTDLIQKLKVWDKTKALEMLAKHFALLTEVVKFPDGLTITWQDKP